jgi:hypothetical protein
MTLQLWSWYAALGAAIGAAIVVYVVLGFSHFNAWTKEHPLLFRVLAVRIISQTSVHRSHEALQACVEAVRRYLPESESRELLGRLDEARSQLQEHRDGWQALKREVAGTRAVSSQTRG